MSQQVQIIYVMYNASHDRTQHLSISLVMGQVRPLHMNIVHKAPFNERNAAINLMLAVFVVGNFSTIKYFLIESCKIPRACSVQSVSTK